MKFDVHRYLLQEKKRGKALDAVANFHLQNGAVCPTIKCDESKPVLPKSCTMSLLMIELYLWQYFSWTQLSFALAQHAC